MYLCLHENRLKINHPYVAKKIPVPWIPTMGYEIPSKHTRDIPSGQNGDVPGKVTWEVSPLTCSNNQHLPSHICRFPMWFQKPTGQLVVKMGSFP